MENHTIHKLAIDTMTQHIDISYNMTLHTEYICVRCFTLWKSLHTLYTIELNGYIDVSVIAWFSNLTFVLLHAMNTSILFKKGTKLNPFYSYETLYLRTWHLAHINRCLTLSTKEKGIGTITKQKSVRKLFLYSFDKGTSLESLKGCI